MSEINLVRRIDKRLAKFPKCSRSQVLAIIIEELKDIAGLRSCLITDENGLSLAESLHKQSNKEDLSAGTALGGEFLERFQDYLKMGRITHSYYETSSTKMWLHKIFLPHSSEVLVLFATKDNSILEKFSTATLKKLGRSKVDVSRLIKIAADLVVKSCKD